MICYSDKTYCRYLDCADKDCHRRFTHEVMQSAKAWWGNPNPPVCFFDEKPDCYITEQE